jgi:hypothetical protein
MAVLDRITIGSQEIIVYEGDPILDGIVASLGSLILMADGSASYIKSAAGDTAWTKAVTVDNLSSEITNSTTDTSVTGKLLTGFVSGAGTVAETDTILEAFQKLNGNILALPAISADNGLTYSSGNIKLGGTLTQNTAIDGAFSWNTGATTPLTSYTVKTGSLATITGEMRISASETSLKRVDNTTGRNDSVGILSTGSYMWAYNISSVTDSVSINLGNIPGTITNNGSNNFMVVRDTSASKGIVYFADYSANFTPESLITKRYSDIVRTAVLGGTGQSTYTTGDILYSSAANTLSKLPIGTNGQVLKVVAGIPAWATDTTVGTVTSVSVVTNQGVSGSVATDTTTPAITLTLGALTGVTSINGLVITANTGTITTGIWNGTAIVDTYISSATNWNTAYTNRITSLTTTGSSGAATLISNVLNIPDYTLAGLGGQPLNTNLTSVSGLTFTSTSFVKMTAAGTFALDTNTYLTANQSITLSGDVTGTGTTAITTSITDATVTGKVLTGYVSGAGTVAATDTILQAIQKLNGNIVANTYTISTGLTNNAGTVTNNLITGLAGGQTIIGGTAASEILTLSSTSNATKGIIKIGTTNTELVNIGSASTTSQKLLRVGSTGNYLDLGHTATGPGSSAAIWMNQATPSSTNYTLSSGGAAGANNTTWNINSPSAVGVMGMALDGVNHFTYTPLSARWYWFSAAVTGGSSTHYRFGTPANLAQTASAETIGFHIDMSLSVQHATGDITIQRDTLITARTHTFVGASVITNADTVHITGAAIGGTNTTITNSSALTIGAGALTNVTNSYGLTINAQTGGTNNYAARFLGGKTLLAASVTDYASLNIATGATPSSPISGDIWFDTDLQFRNGGTTVNLSGTVGVSRGGTGTTTNFTQNSIVFAGASGIYTQDTSFTYNTTTKQLALSGTDTTILLAGITTEPTAPAAGNLLLYSKLIAGRMLPKFLGPSGVDNPIQSGIFFNNVSLISPGSGTTASVISCAITNVGTISHPTPTTTNLKAQTRRFVNTMNNPNGSLASTRIGVLECWRGNAAGLGGFFVVARFGIETLGTGNRMFVGLTDTATTAPTNIDPTTSTTPGKIGMAINTNTGNWNVVHNITGTAPTVIALGANFPVNTTSLYELVLFAVPNSATVGYRVTNLTSGTQTSGTISTNLPASTTFMGRTIWMTNNATNGTLAWSCSRFGLETDY